MKTTHQTDALRDRLKALRAELGEKRSVRAAHVRERDEAAGRFAGSNVPLAKMTDSAEFKAAERAKDAVASIDAELEQLQAAEIGILEMLGEGTQAGPGSNGPDPLRERGTDGWEQAAHTLSIREGAGRAEITRGSALLRPMMAAVTTPPGLTQPTTLAPFIQEGQDRRFLYRAFSQQQLDPGVLSISDFMQVGARRAVTIEADDDTVTSNAHGYADGNRVAFIELTGGAPLTVGETYYVRDVTAHTFKVAETEGGPAVNVTSDATAGVVVNLDTLGRQVTGDVERDPLATTEKAKLDLAIALANDPVRQFAVVVEKVPDKLFDVVPALTTFLRSELQWQLERAIDSHVTTRILDATPLAGSDGVDLIAKVRNAVSTMTDVGASPSVLAVNPATAATLDLTRDGADQAYLFVTRSTGGASPLWGLRIAEVPGLEAPILIDPATLGVLYIGGADIVADPYTGLSTNEVRVRSELEALMHIRNGNGAYVIA